MPPCLKVQKIKIKVGVHEKAKYSNLILLIISFALLFNYQIQIIKFKMIFKINNIKEMKITFNYKIVKLNYKI